MQTRKKTANKWEYKIGNNANTANCACLWKTWLGMSVGLPSVLYLETYFLLSYGVKGFDW